MTKCKNCEALGPFLAKQVYRNIHHTLYVLTCADCGEFTPMLLGYFYDEQTAIEEATKIWRKFNTPDETNDGSEEHF